MHCLGLGKLTNSPCQHLKKCTENSTENMQTDVGGCKGLAFPTKNY